MVLGTGIAMHKGITSFTENSNSQCAIAGPDPQKETMV